LLFCGLRLAAGAGCALASRPSELTLAAALTLAFLALSLTSRCAQALHIHMIILFID
jgi:hypothetical protein